MLGGIHFIYIYIYTIHSRAYTGRGGKQPKVNKYLITLHQETRNYRCLTLFIKTMTKKDCKSTLFILLFLISLLQACFAQPSCNLFFIAFYSNNF